MMNMDVDEKKFAGNSKIDKVLVSWLRSKTLKIERDNEKAEKKMTSTELSKEIANEIRKSVKNVD